MSVVSVPDHVVSEQKPVSGSERLECRIRISKVDTGSTFVSAIPHLLRRPPTLRLRLPHQPFIQAVPIEGRAPLNTMPLYYLSNFSKSLRPRSRSESIHILDVRARLTPLIVTLALLVDAERMLPAAYLDDLDRFARLVWGNPQALLRRLPPQGVEFIDLGEYFNALQYLFAPSLQHDKILVREEYHTALQPLQTNEYRGGAYVTGHPGIGKTYFLVYALIHFLGGKQPVALHDLAGNPFYIIFKDNIAVYSIGYVVPLNECGFVWALSDSNADVQIPPSVFRTDPRRIRVIQATSPNASRYKRWSKELGATCYVMDIWTEDEVENLAKLLGLDVERMVTLARKWGTTPGPLLKYINKEDQKVEDLYRGLVQQAVEKCALMMDEGLLLDIPIDDPASLFYFIRPRINAPGSLYRKFSDVAGVPTQTLRELLEEWFRDQNNQTKLEFYETLRHCAVTRQITGCISEPWIHGFLSARREMQCE